MRLARRDEDAPVAPPRAERKLGDLLVDSGAATSEQVREALKRQRRDRRPVGEILVDLGVASERVTSALGWQMGLIPVNLDNVEVQPQALDCVDVGFARERGIFPYAIDASGRLQVATTDPQDADLARRLVEMAGRSVRLELADAQAIHDALDRHYTVLDKVGAAVERAVISGVQEVPVAELAPLSPDAPVVQIVNLIIMQGLRDRVSDIHIEPQATQLRVRYRVDGALRDVQSLPSQLGGPIASRLKIMAGMDIVDRHRSQDGQTSMEVDGRFIDIRISTMATIWGEKVVMRLLDRSRSVMSLGDLGLRDEEHRRLTRLVVSPYGLLIVSGPTGAGKTTTLYASLNELDRTTRNITTIEDPVEYQFDDINQIQINRLAGTTFANGLRAILRQDPDTILVGEVRDVDTAQIAVQSALTGHLVLCSLHAADSVGALYRFLDMGIEAFLVASAGIGIVAQRLVRTICRECEDLCEVRPEEAEFYRTIRGTDPPHLLLAGRGCRRCSGTGYYDRAGVFECMEIDDTIREMVVRHATHVELRQRAREMGMRSLQENACELVEQGRTTISEVMRTVYLI